MRAGDLVKVTRASIGVPLGSVGLIVKSFMPRGSYAEGTNEKIHELQLIGTKAANRRYLTRDLEVINESR